MHRFNDLGVANMRVALKGIEVEKHLMASRAAYEMSAEVAGTTDENLQRNLVGEHCTGALARTACHARCPASRTVLRRLMWFCPAMHVQDALKDVEEWACTQLQICLGSQAKGGKGAAAAGGGAATAPGIDGAKKAAMAEMAGLDGGAGAEQLRNFIKVQVDAALGKLAQTVETNKMDFDILDSSMVRSGARLACHLSID